MRKLFISTMNFFLELFFAYTSNQTPNIADMIYEEDNKKLLKKSDKITQKNQF